MAAENAPVPPELLYRTADLGALEFATTAELAPLPGLTQQPRAEQAIAFGTEIAHRGFNIFAIGATGARVQESVRALLDAAADPIAMFHVYVRRFVTSRL